jgi:peptidoglycan L-alanyl-D-glutamate endopeptidase CwlK
MSYTLGEGSLFELVGVAPRLVLVVNRAIQITTQDFTVHDGLRTVEEQKKLVLRGASKTMFSKHLPQTDGFGHAVDLVPYINGKLRWEWEPIYNIAAAMYTASVELDIDLIWGGVWDTPMSAYGGGLAAMRKAVADYCIRHVGADFIDGPHYELR